MELYRIKSNTGTLSNMNPTKKKNNKTIQNLKGEQAHVNVNKPLQVILRSFFTE